MTTKKLNPARQTQNTLMALVLAGVVLQTSDLFGQTKKENGAQITGTSITQLNEGEGQFNAQPLQSQSLKASETADSIVDRTIKKIKGIS